MKSQISRTTWASVLLHAAIASVFVYTFKPKNQAPQTLLVFLGSILQSQDFGFQETGRRVRTQFSSEDRSLRKAAGALPQPEGFDKPSFEKHPEFQSTKIYLRTEFPKEKIEPAAEKAPANQRNLAGGLKDYIPLRSIFQ